MLITAKLQNYRQSPRKVRLVADLVKGKNVEDAITALSFIIKTASQPIAKLVKSAIKNAEHNFNLKKENLFVKDLRVDGGAVLKRRMPRARGSAYQILKRTSNVLLVLDEKK
jgi:large subunit ribosomal protein L22